ncbi:MAG: peroxiredoxin [Rhodothermales bacterium]
MIKPGDTAPDFTLYSHEKEPFQLSAQRGVVVLLFFPGAFSSVCTTELNDVNNDLAGFGDATVVGISTDSPFTLNAFAEQNGFSFRLLSDHDAEVCAAYDVKYDRDFTPMQLDRIAKRAAFVVDRDGVVQHVQIMEHAGKMPDLDAIKQSIASL